MSRRRKVELRITTPNYIPGPFYVCGNLKMLVKFKKSWWIFQKIKDLDEKAVKFVMFCHQHPLFFNISVRLQDTENVTKLSPASYNSLQLKIAELL